MDAEQYRNDFLWFTYFGITQAEAKNQDVRIARCIDRAYMDLSRTVHYRLSASVLSDMKKKTSTEKRKAEAKAFEDRKNKFRGEVRGYLAGQIKDLLGNTCIGKESFDEEWHLPTCEEIKRLANENYGDLLKPNKRFTFGQAQKWVNMTLKNMKVMNLDDFGQIVKVMHVPIDSYILEAARKKYSEKLHRSFDVCGLGVAPGFREKWSNLDDPGEYLAYQKEIRDATEKADSTPIEWEGPAWIAQAKAEAEKAS